MPPPSRAPPRSPRSRSLPDRHTKPEPQPQPSLEPEPEPEPPNLKPKPSPSPSPNPNPNQVSLSELHVAALYLECDPNGDGSITYDELLKVGKDAETFYAQQQKLAGGGNSSGSAAVPQVKK